MRHYQEYNTLINELIRCIMSQYTLQIYEKKVLWCICISKETSEYNTFVNIHICAINSSTIVVCQYAIGILFS